MMGIHRDRLGVIETTWLIVDLNNSTVFQMSFYRKRPGIFHERCRLPKGIPIHTELIS